MICDRPSVHSFCDESVLSARALTRHTQITYGRHDVATSTCFADALKSGFKNSEMIVFETYPHAAIYESVSEFNDKTLGFLRRDAGHARRGLDLLVGFKFKGR